MLEIIPVFTSPLISSVSSLIAISSLSQRSILPVKSGFPPVVACVSFCLALEVWVRFPARIPLEKLLMSSIWLISFSCTVRIFEDASVLVMSCCCLSF